MPKGSSGVNRGALKRADTKMKADSKRGVISMSIRDGIPSKDANALYELLDKNYPYLSNYKWEDLGIGGYAFYTKTASGWQYDGWHTPFPENVRSDSAKRGFIKLQMYDREGRIER